MTDEHRALLAHLFRRAGFGARKADLDAYASKDYSTAVEDLVAPALRKQNSSALLTQETGEPLLQPALSDVQKGWLGSMIASASPLAERMTLFLSNHFVAAYQAPNVDAAALVAHHSIIRKHALGSFAELAHAMIDDKAQSCYLNNERNRAAKPNENLGRELMELFMLGSGTYSERDVKETARALTGYTLVTPAPGMRKKLVFDKTLHDAGPKTILGVTSNFTPHGVVDLFLSQPTSRRFIAQKLVAHFVGPDPGGTLAGTVASSLARNWRFDDALRTIFYSQQFRATSARQALPKSPAEYVAGLMRALGRTEVHEGVSYMAQAGQTLFRPPSVVGWPTGKRMLGPGAVLARYNAASAFARIHATNPSANAPSGLALAPWMEALGLTSLSQPTIDALNAYLAATARNTTAVRTAGLITVLASSPDFNLS